MSPGPDPVVLLARVAPGAYRLANAARLWVHDRWLCPGTVSRGPDTGRRVALTFDDGPDPRWTPDILDVLAAHGARATFFQVGRGQVEHAELARRVELEGHQVGTHLLAHARPAGRSRRAQLDELDQALAVYEEVLGHRPTAMRFPYGQVGRLGPADWGERGLAAYHWTFSSHDSRAPSPAAIVERVVTLAGPGDIVLLHDGYGAGSSLGPGHRDHTVAALPAILRAFGEKGLEAVTLDELFRSS